MDTIKKVVIKEPLCVEIQESGFPDLKADEVLLKVKFGGICGSDLSVYKGGMSVAGVNYPRIAGHEFSAEVVEIGKDVSDLKPGSIVTANPYFNCQDCYSCRRGLVNCCISNETCGVQRDGIFAQYITLPRDRVYDGKGIAADKLALVEPFCIGYHAVKRAHVCEKEKVLVIGAGTIGMMAAMSAVIMGGEATLCDVSPDKLKLAAEFGIQHTILNHGRRPLKDSVAELTDGNGYDVVVEAVGLPQTVQDCVDSAAFGGRIILIGVVKQLSEFQFDTIRNKYLTVAGSRNALPEDFKEVIDIVASERFSMEHLISKVFPMEQAAEAFQYFAEYGSSSFKIMLEF